jgi:tRNA A37 threonylcarbamoyladenosine synthetase subunit TsaC/SUA5/YrdC
LKDILLYQVKPTINDTKIKKNGSNQHHRDAASLLNQKTEIVAIPTETVYGLAGNAYSESTKRFF